MPADPTFGPPDYLALAQKIGDPEQNNPLQALAQRQAEVGQRLQGSRNEMAKAMQEWAKPVELVLPPPKDPNAESRAYRAAMLRHLYAQYPYAPIEHLQDAVDQHMQSMQNANAAGQQWSSYGT